MSTKFPSRLRSASGLILASFLLISCSDNDSSPTPTPTPTPSGDAFDLDGKVAKGLILGGNVSVYDPAAQDTPLVTGTTSTTDGSYQLSIPAEANFEGDIVKVVVTGGEGALMICDVSPQCSDDVGFGDTFEIDSDFSISALVSAPGDGGTASVHVTALTDLAASLAEANAGNDGVSLDDVTEANSQTASVFGLLSSDLASIEPVDVTDPDATAASQDSVAASLLSAGILAAAIENDEGLAGVSNTMDALADTFADQSGQLVANEGEDSANVISLEDILEGAVAAAAESPLSDDDVNIVESGLEGRLINVKSEPEDELTSSKPSPTAGATALEKGKAFVEDLSALSALIEADDTIAELENFAEGVEEAVTLQEDALGDVANITARALEAMFHAYEAHYEDTDLTSFTRDGVMVAITSDDTGVTLAIDQSDLDGADVDLTARIDDQIDYTVDEEAPDDTYNYFIQELFEGDADASLVGTIETDAFTSEIIRGTLEAVDVDIVYVSSNAITSQTDEVHETQTVEQIELALGRLRLNLEVLLTEKATNGLSFEGVASADLSGLEVDGSNVVFNIDWSEIGVNQSRITLPNLSTALSGLVSHNGQTVDVSLSANLTSENAEFTAEPEQVETSVWTKVDDTLVQEFPKGDVTTTTWIANRDDVTATTDDLIFSNQVPYGTGSTLSVFYNETEVALVLNSIDDDGTTYYAVHTDWTDETERDQTVFLQLHVLQIENFGYPEDSFFDDPPLDDIVAFRNGLSANAPHFLTCGGENGLDLALAPPQILEGPGPEYVLTGALLLENAYECVFDNGIGYYYIDAISTGSFNDGAAGSALISASLRQDIVGIDEVDPSVEVSLSAAADVAEGNVTGVASFQLAFAGRRFETNSLSFAQLEDLQDPLVVRNQDGVVLTIEQDENEDLTGTLTLDDEQLATVSEDAGLIVFTFSDDTFTSF